MSASKPQESGEVRIAHSLNEKEEKFVRRRRKTVQQSLQRLDIHCSLDKVPNISLLGSGGGQRAMVALLGSLVQLEKAGLLDCVLYLSGVSGSTWCMASLYQEPEWSTKLEKVKDKIVKRISGPAVTWTDAWAKLKKYYEKDYYSLTDFWAVAVVTTYVKEIDEHTLTDQQQQHSSDPFPIYTVIDKQCKQSKDGDPWFEISPYEAGYSLIGAFVKTSSFSSQFDKGRKIKPQPEDDMLYLQAQCGSALADGYEILQFIWEKIKEFFKHIIKMEITEEMRKDPNSPPVDKCLQVLMDLVDMNLAVLQGTDPSQLEESIRATLYELSGGKVQLIFEVEKLDLTDKKAAKLYMKHFTLDVCNYLNSLYANWILVIKIFISTCKCAAQWIWGRTYDFLHNMKDREVPAPLLESKTRDYIDAGLLLNSPYFPVLRKERNTDIIISLDFSDGDPFKTVTDAAKMCSDRHIPFPPVIIPEEDKQKPKDFYVFKGQNAPTVIHIPLFNVVNCGGELEAWRKKYATFQGAYSAKMITDLMDVAGKNISNNKERLKQVICAVIG